LVGIYTVIIEPFNPELNPICHLLALLGAHHILHISRIKVNTGSNGKGTRCNTQKEGTHFVLYTLLRRALNNVTVATA
jgi:folylpolyglutamate synthase/dihydropteroate synthase